MQHLQNREKGFVLKFLLLSELVITVVASCRVMSHGFVIPCIVLTTFVDLHVTNVFQCSDHFVVCGSLICHSFPRIAQGGFCLASVADVGGKMH